MAWLVGSAIIALLAPPLVTLSEPGKSTGEVVARLAQETGLALEVSPAIRAIPLTVYVEGVSVGELLDRVAEVLGARWIDRDGKRILTRNSRDRLALQREERAARVALLERHIGKLADEIRDELTEERARSIADQLDRLEARRRAGEWTPDLFEELESLRASRATSRAIARFLVGVPLTELAELEPGDARIFSPTPTRMQSPLGPRGKDLAAAFWRDQDVWRQVAAERPPRGEETVWEDPRTPTFPDQTPPSPIRFAVTVWDSVSMLVELQYRGRQGQWLTAGTRVVHLYETDLLESPAATSEPLPVRVPPASAYLSSLDRGEGEMSTRPVPAEWEKVLRQPDSEDPIGVTSGPIVTEWARKTRRRLVANLPDETALLSFHFGQAPDIDANRFLAIAEQAGLLTRREEGAWTLLRSATPLLAERTRAPRRGLANLRQSVERERRVSLDAFADYAGQCGPVLPLFTPFFLATNAASDNWLGGPSGWSLSVGSDWDAYRLYGMLDPASRRLLRNGGRLRIAGLPGPARDLATKLFFRLEFGRAESQPDGVRTGSSPADFLLGKHATDRFGQGLPPDAYLEGRSPKAWTFWQARRTSSGALRWERIGMAWEMAAAISELRQGTLPGGRPVGFAWAKEAGLTLRIGAGDVWADIDLGEDPVFADLEPKSWEEFPAEIKGMLEKILERFDSATGQRQGPDRVPPREP